MDLVYLSVTGVLLAAVWGLAAGCARLQRARSRA